MANNSTQASFMIRCGSTTIASQVWRWLCNEGPYPTELRKMMENEGAEFDEDGQCEYSIADAQIDQDDHTQLWVNFQDGDMSITVAVVKYTMDLMHEMPSPQGWTWANTCSRPRIGEFDGGAVFIARGETTRWMNSTQWLEEQT